MKHSILALAATLFISNGVQAAECSTYPHDIRGPEISADDVQQVGRALKNRANNDKIYLSCSEVKDGECTHTTMVLEAISCADANSPRYFNLTPETDFLADDGGRLAQNFKFLKNYDAKGAINLIKASYTVVYWSEGEPVLLALLPITLPVAAAIDAVSLPIRTGIFVTESIDIGLSMHKVRHIDEINQVAVGKRARKISHENFTILLDALKMFDRN